MTIMTRLDGRQHASQAGRGSLSSLEQLLRALVDDEVRDIPVPGVGITDGVGAVHKASVHERGGIITTSILLDLTGLKSGTTDLDIIGEAATAGPAHLGQITAAINGTILGGRMTCLEVPASLDDIDLYSAEEPTGAHEDGVAGTLTETALITSGAAWTIGRQLMLTGIPPANDYLYLANGAADTADDFTAGKFLIELFGYDA
jgi:hypothetical protein